MTAERQAQVKTVSLIGTKPRPCSQCDNTARVELQVRSFAGPKLIWRRFCFTCAVDIRQRGQYESSLQASY